MATNFSTYRPNDGIEELTRLPELAGPLLQIDLERELQQLREEDCWQWETGRSSKTLAKHSDFRIVLILMKNGTRMCQHRAKGRVSIQQLKGQSCVHLADRKVNVPAGNLLVLDCGVLHDVEALEESAFLLTISWPSEQDADRQFIASAQEYLDEEASPRMEDEGGSHDRAIGLPSMARKAAYGSYRYFKGHPIRTWLHELYVEPKEVAMASKTVLMIGCTTKLMRREEVAEGTMAYHFEKPHGFDFEPGQYIDMTLRNPPETDTEGNTRTFSIASAPFENELVFITRMRDTAFKRSLEKIALDSEVKIDQAMGSFTLHKDLDKPAVFLAGGIGITPFLSMVQQADKDRLAQMLYLFYSNRRPEDAAFLSSLQALVKTNSNLRLICTMTEMSKSTKEWKGETAPLDTQMLSRYLGFLQGPVYYIAGPPTMLMAMRKMLVSAGVEKIDIRTEGFTGY